MGRPSKLKRAALRNAKKGWDARLKATEEKRKAASSNHVEASSSQNPKQPENPTFNGRRIISCKSLLDSIIATCAHGRRCHKSRMIFDREEKTGLATDIYLKCKQCNWFLVIKGDSGTETYELNRAFAWGSNSVPIGFDDACKFLTCLDIPPTTQHMFYDQKKKLTGDMVKAARMSSLENAKD